MRRPGSGIVEGGRDPLHAGGAGAAAEELRGARDRRSAAPSASRSACPAASTTGEPFQIFQRPRDLTLLYQFGHPVRTIHTNGTRHPDGHIDFWLGDSRGRWEGDTLVVDVIDFNGETWLDRAGNFHSDALHVVERWTLLDANTLEYRATLEDPKVYTRPWSLSVLLHRHREPNAQLLENYCYTLDYDQLLPGAADVDVDAIRGDAQRAADADARRTRPVARGWPARRSRR